MRNTFAILAIGTALAALPACTAPESDPSAAAAAAPAPSASLYTDAVSAPGRPASMIALDEGRKPAEVLAFFGLQRGDNAVDLYAGEGYFTELMARVVGPGGSVTGTMSVPSYSDQDTRAALDALVARNPNVRINAGPVDRFDYPAGSLDFVMMSMSYHDLYFVNAQYGYPEQDPRAFLRQVFAALRPGGTVAVIDHVANPGGDTRQVVDTLHRIDPAVIRADFESAGFVLEAESNLLRVPADDHTIMVFDPAIRGRTDRVVYRFRRPG